MIHLAWFENIGITGGVLAGKNIVYNAVNGDGIQWQGAPRPGLVSGMMLYCNITDTGYTYSDKINGLLIISVLPSVIGETITLAEIPLKGSDTKTYAVQARCSGYSADGTAIELTAYLRTWNADHSSYTQIQKSQIAGYYIYSNAHRYNRTITTKFVCGKMTYQGQDWFVTALRGDVERQSGGSHWCRFDGFATLLTTFKESILGGDLPDPELESDEFGPASEPGGYGYGGVGQPSFDDSSDLIPVPSPPKSILDLGFLNVYKCQSNSLVDLGASIFPEIPPLPTPSTGATIQDVLEFLGSAIMAFSDSIWNKNLLDYIISVHMVPGDVESSNPLEDIKVGARTLTGILGRKIDSEYYDFEFGSLNIKSYFANYADFMTHGKLFLPFYGYVDMQPEYWQSGVITIKYRFNAIDGSFNAYVLSSSGFSNLEDSVIAQYGGTACIHIPTTGANYAELFSTLIGAGAGAVEAGLRPQPGGSDTMSSKSNNNAKELADDNLEKFFSRRTLGIGSNAIDAALAVASGPAAMHGGGYNASSGIMSMRMPYLIIERPVPSFSVNYAQEQGLPLNVTKKLGDVHGFTVASNIHLDKINCTARERSILENLLESGVILP